MAKSSQRKKSVIKREFTETELRDLRTAFDILDQNKDGRVTTNELQFMLKKLGIEVRDEKVQELIKGASHSGNELIDENEFLQWVKKIQALLPDEAGEDDGSKDIVAAFRVFDLDQNGFITRDELRTAMEMIGETVTEQQLTEFITIADLDKDGKINYEEFAKAML